MTIDLNRPPARLPPRLTDYAVVVVAWFVFFGIAVFTGFVSASGPSRGAALITLILTLISLAVALYLSIRIGWRALACSWVTDLRKHAPVGGAEFDRRSADREDFEARRLLRKGKISRAEYERRIAYRRFVHGEISRAEHRSVLWSIDSAQQTVTRK